MNQKVEQGWLRYTVSFLLFHAASIIALYALLRLQSVLPLNPQDMAGVSPDLALNTAVSFVTNTSWQSYGGETTLSYAEPDGRHHRPLISFRRLPEWRSPSH